MTCCAERTQGGRARDNGGAHSFLLEDGTSGTRPFLVTTALLEPAAA